MQTNRLINRQELMKSVWPRWADTQSKIDLRERFDGDRHGPMIVISTLDLIVQLG
jgi:hypothetical protein